MEHGNLLYARGIAYEQCFDELNLTQPDSIQDIHCEYITAGAQIIEPIPSVQTR